MRRAIVSPACGHQRAETTITVRNTTTNHSPALAPQRIQLSEASLTMSRGLRGASGVRPNDSVASLPQRVIAFPRLDRDLNPQPGRRHRPWVQPGRPSRASALRSGIVVPARASGRPIEPLRDGSGWRPAPALVSQCRGATSDPDEPVRPARDPACGGGQPRACAPPALGTSHAGPRPALGAGPPAGRLGSDCSPSTPDRARVRHDSAGRGRPGRRRSRRLSPVRRQSPPHRPRGHHSAWFFRAVRSSRAATCTTSVSIPSNRGLRTGKVARQIATNG
jgi:hypothetical protein